MTRRQIVSACLVALVGAAAPLDASVVLPGDLRELSKQALVVVRGRVVDVRARQLAGSRRVESLVTFSASEYLKGDLGTTVTFQVPGGRVGRYRTVVVGAPVLSPGDELVLFLGGRPPGLPHVLGLSQGLFRVVLDPRTGRRMVSPPPLLGAGAGAVRVVRGDPARRLATVDEFGALVVRVLSEAPLAAGERP